MKLFRGLIMTSLFILLSSCSLTSSSRGEGTGPDAGFGRRRVEEYFVSSGVERFFLPEVPYWANFSEEAQCRRKTSIKFFNMDALRSSLRLDYEESIHLQLMFNDEVQRVKAEKQIGHIPFENEEEIFYQVSDRIQAGIRIFRKPNFKRVNVIWIDPYRDRPSSLKSILNQPDMVSGHPVFMSLCLTFQEMGQWMNENGFNQQNIRKIPYELLTPYTAAGELDTSYHMNFDEILKDKKVYLYIKKGWEKPTLFDGQFKLINL